MNKQFLAAAMMLMAVTANPVFAHNSSDNIENIIRYVKLTSPVKKLIITGDADVILTKDGSSEIAIEGKPVFANGVKLINQDGNLEVIISRYNRSNKPVIRIPVQQLEALEIHGDGKVYTESVLRSDNLTVYINGNCEVGIRSTGNIVIDASADYELKYIKDEKMIFFPVS